MTDLSDLIIFVPGILGSVLERNGEKIWNTSISVLLDVLKRGKQIRTLALDDPDADDGVRAVGLIQGATLIPGLWKIDVYAGISRYIKSRFRFASSKHPAEPSGFHEFPYDWRRDNRRSGKELATFVENRLREWRDFRKNPKARVILVGHSMGGLVSSYYLENEEGWKKCRALITLGTPFRGSLRAVNYLANGYRLYGMNLSDPLRSMPSVYQLLPDYKVVRGDGSDNLLQDTAFTDVVSNAKGKWSSSDKQYDLFSRGLAFHQEIRAAAKANGHGEKLPYSVVCYVGTKQPTFQSAQVDGGKCSVNEMLPREIHNAYSDGDGVVPHYSAIHDAARGNPARLHSFAAFHASLPSNPHLLEDLSGVLRQFQVGEYREVGFVPPTGDELRIEELRDCYEVGAPIGFRARIPGGGVGVPLEAQVLFEGAIAPTRCRVKQTGGVCEFELRDAPEGIHRLTVQSPDPAQVYPKPVSDVFAILPRRVIDEA